MQQKSGVAEVINLVNLRLINNLNSTLVRGNIPTTKGKANKTEVYKMSKSKIANAKNAKEYTIHFLSTHSTASRSELLSSMRCEMPDMSYSILGGALHQLCKNGDIVSIERGVYSLGVSKCEDDPFICSMEKRKSLFGSSSCECYERVGKMSPYHRRLRGHGCLH